MKIAFLLNSVSRNSGGVFDACRRLGQTLAERDEVEVLGLRDEFTADDLAGWAPLQPRVFEPALPGNFGVARGYAAELQRLDPALVHVHALWIYPSLAGYRWQRRTKRPLIYTAHGMLDPWAVRNSGWKKRLVRALWEDAAHRSAACFHAISESEYRSMRAFGLRNPICVIPNGMDLREEVGNRRSEVGDLREEGGSRKSEVGSQGEEVGDRRSEGGSWKEEVGGRTSDIGHLTSGTKTLLYLGRLHPKKNLVALLRGWAEVGSRRSEVGSRKSEEWQLAIAGWDQGGYEAELKRLARELGLSFAEVGDQRSEVGLTSDLGHLTSDFRPPTSSVSLSFVGPRFGEEKAAAYRNADAFILPSLSEGLPMVVLEAWAYGKPVLMTPECNLPEGFAVNAALQIGATPDTIATGLHQLMEMSDDERIAMGARGHALVAEKFSWPRIGEQMRAVYEWVLGGGGVPDCVRMK